MRTARPFERGPSPRLFFRRSDDRLEWWTETVGRPPAVYGERWMDARGRTFRSFEPARSKLGAALARGWTGRLPHPGERWLYLGAASGTTASHVADLVGADGAVFAVEKSPRPFARFLEVAERWPNLLPILADAREPESYLDLLEPVDGIYADISQPDQAGLLLRHAELCLRPSGGAFLLALKTPSLGREKGGLAHLRDAEERLGRLFSLDPSVRLEPFHRGHYLLGGIRGSAPASTALRPESRARPRSGRPFRRRPDSRPARRRP